MADLLARSDYPLPTVDPLLALALGLLAAAAVLAFVAWAVGAFDRSGKGRHAADRPQSPPWINERYRDAMTWLVRNQKAQQELADAQQGDNR